MHLGLVLCPELYLGSGCIHRSQGKWANNKTLPSRHHALAQATLNTRQVQSKIRLRKAKTTLDKTRLLPEVKARSSAPDRLVGQGVAGVGREDAADPLQSFLELAFADTILVDWDVEVVVGCVKSPRVRVEGAVEDDAVLGTPYHFQDLLLLSEPEALRARRGEHVDLKSRPLKAYGLLDVHDLVDDLLPQGSVVSQDDGVHLLDLTRGEPSVPLDVEVHSVHVHETGIWRGDHLTKEIAYLPRSQAGVVDTPVRVPAGLGREQVNQRLAGSA